MPADQHRLGRGLEDAHRCPRQSAASTPLAGMESGSSTAAPTTTTPSASIWQLVEIAGGLFERSRRSSGRSRSPRTLRDPPRTTVLAPSTIMAPMRSPRRRASIAPRLDRAARGGPASDGPPSAGWRGARHVERAADLGAVGQARGDRRRGRAASGRGLLPPRRLRSGSPPIWSGTRLRLPIAPSSRPRRRSTRGWPGADQSVSGLVREGPRAAGVVRQRPPRASTSAARFWCWRGASESWSTRSTADAGSDRARAPSPGEPGSRPNTWRRKLSLRGVLIEPAHEVARSRCGSPRRARPARRGGGRRPAPSPRAAWWLAMPSSISNSTQGSTPAVARGGRRP